MLVLEKIKFAQILTFVCDIEKRLRDGAENMECFKVISLSYVLPLVLSSKGGWMQFIIVVRFFGSAIAIHLEAQ